MTAAKARPAPLTRSQTMARVKSINTTPELAVRKFLHAAGLRYRLHRADLPGRPDIVFAARKTIVFVHGCFWHAHPGCRRARVPATRRAYWEAKLARNVARDAASRAALEAAGWDVEVVWECELHEPDRLADLAARLKRR